MRPSKNRPKTADKGAPPVDSDQVNAQARGLLAKVHQEAGDWMLPPERRPKTKPAREVVLSAPPELQVAFIRQVVDAFVKIATPPKGKRYHVWNSKAEAPYPGGRVVEKLLRRRLPFTNDQLVEMLEALSEIPLLPLVYGLEGLVREMEKRSAEGKLTERGRKALERVADQLMGRELKPEDAEEYHENWGFPCAADRKLAARIERLLSGPLELG